MPGPTPPRPASPVPDVSVVVPTRHEAENVVAVHRALVQALAGRAWEVVFTDDSDDDTPQVISGLSAKDPRVRLLHRRPEQRQGGLGGAVMAAAAVAAADVVVVMDADLQHPPAVVARLLDALDDSGADLAVATRYAGSGDSGGLAGAHRVLVSQGCRLLVRAAFSRARACSDPLGGFFAVRRSVLTAAELHPRGYKLLLEVLVRCPWRGIVEVPYAFAARQAGESKSGLAEGRRFAGHVLALHRETRHRAAAAGAARPALRVVDAPRPPRVLQLTSEAPPVVSGISTIVGQFDRGLRALGATTSVVSRADFPRFCRGEVRLSAFALAWPRWRRVLAEQDAVVVHGPVPTISDAFLLLVRTLPRAQRPAVVYVHHSDLAITWARRACAAYTAVNRRLAQLADAVVVSTHEYARRIEVPGGAPVEVVPWGVEARRTLPRAAAAGTPSGAAADEPLRVLFVGQLRPYKGVQVLLEAVAGLPGVRTSVVGDGPERRRLERLAADGGTDAVFHGRVDDDALWRAYADADVVVLPSLTSAEAYGLVLAEGMAAGCVPVASDLPGVREVAGPTGLLVPPGDAAALRAALARLAADRADLAERAARSALRGQDLSVEAASQHLLEVVTAAVARRGAAPVAPRQHRVASSDLWHRVDAAAHQLGVSAASLAVLHPAGSPTGARVAVRGGGLRLVASAPVAQFVSSLARPVLLAPGAAPEPGLVPLLRRPEVTSAILVPVEATGGSCVVSLSRDASHGGPFTPADVERLVAILDVPQVADDGPDAALPLPARRAVRA